VLEAKFQASQNMLNGAVWKLQIEIIFLNWACAEICIWFYILSLWISKTKMWKLQNHLCVCVFFLPCTVLCRMCMEWGLEVEKLKASSPKETLHCMFWARLC
jgi:hypothetical protein